MVALPKSQAESFAAVSLSFQGSFAFTPQGSRRPSTRAFAGRFTSRLKFPGPRLVEIAISESSDRLDLMISIWNWVTKQVPLLYKRWLIGFHTPRFCFFPFLMNSSRPFKFLHYSSFLLSSPLPYPCFSPFAPFMFPFCFLTHVVCPPLKFYFFLLTFFVLNFHIFFCSFFTRFCSLHP